MPWSSASIIVPTLTFPRSQNTTFSSMFSTFFFINSKSRVSLFFKLKTKVYKRICRSERCWQGSKHEWKHYFLKMYFFPGRAVQACDRIGGHFKMYHVELHSQLWAAIPCDNYLGDMEMDPICKQRKMCFTATCSILKTLPLLPT